MTADIATYLNQRTGAVSIYTLINGASVGSVTLTGKEADGVAEEITKLRLEWRRTKANGGGK
jgi:hypothetical protein